MADRIRAHFITLIDGDLVLHPMTEEDWNFLFRWNHDPEVLWLSEGDHATSRVLEDVQGIYRGVCRSALTGRTT